MGPRVLISAPRRELLREMLISHIVHHRAQLGVYYRLLDVPVPGTYRSLRGRTAAAMTASRWMLLAASVLLTFGGITHLRAFPKAAAAADASAIAPFFGNSLKALWVMDSAAMFVVAAIGAVILARPGSASATVIGLLSLMPLSTAALLYLFLGNFPAAHLLMVVAGCLAGAALTR